MRAQLLLKNYMLSDVVKMLVIKLKDLQDLDETNLLVEVMHAIDKLLELDQEFPDEFSMENSVSFYFEEYNRGFDELEALQSHQNEEIYTMAR